MATNLRGMWLLALAACGRVNFDPRGDGPRVDDVATGDRPIGAPISVVQNQDIFSPNSVTATLPVTPTMPGSFLVVMTANVDTASGTVVSISDDASNTWVSADAMYLQASGNGETWFAANANPGVSMVTITGAAAGRREIWFLEVRGPSSRDVAGVIEQQPTSSIVRSPAVTPTSTPALLVAHINISFSVDQLVAGPFMGLSSLNGDSAAYAVVDVPDSYSAAWSYSNTGTFSASTVAFTSL